MKVDEDIEVGGGSIPGCIGCNRKTFPKDLSFEDPQKLGGGFKYLLFSPLFVEDSYFDDHIFQMG